MPVATAIVWQINRKDKKRIERGGVWRNNVEIFLLYFSFQRSPMYVTGWGPGLVDQLFEMLEMLDN
jgi:hypothetical protein